MKIEAINIQPNPYQKRLTSHSKLDFMVELHLQGGAIQRRFFAQKVEAKQFVGRQFLLGNIICKKDETNALH